MNIAIRYFSKGGNTKKMAEAVAEVVGTPALETTANLEETADILFLGSSVYAGKYSKEVEEFLESNKDSIKEIVCFGSSASGKSTQPQVKKWGEKNGVQVNDKFYSCRGHFLFAFKDRPNEEDLNSLKAFAKEILGM
ncbi:MAG: flavodoxin [Bacilli bacterium]|nr:flavodoxin [Bacilli bacterium]